MEENQTQDPAQEQQGPQLSIADLQNLRAVVDLAVRRGAFSGAEATSVGQVFDRVNTFLNAVAPAAQAPGSSQEDTPSEVQ